MKQAIFNFYWNNVNAISFVSKVALGLACAAGLVALFVAPLVELASVGQ